MGEIISADWATPPVILCYDSPRKWNNVAEDWQRRTIERQMKVEPKWENDYRLENEKWDSGFTEMDIWYI